MTRESEHNVRGEARVVTVRDSRVTIEVSDVHIRKNEVGFICVGKERLMAEVCVYRESRLTCRYLKKPMECV